MQMMRPSPTLRRTMLNNLTGAVNMLLDEKDLDGAARLLEMAETVAEAIGTPWALAECHYWRGRLELEQGNLEAAASHFEKLSSIEDPEKQVIAIHSLALALFHTGNLVKAERQFHETIMVAQEHSSSLGMAQGYLGLAMIARMKNNVSEAKQWLGHARQYAETAHAADVIAQIMTEQGLLAAQGEDTQLAAEYHQGLEEYLKQPVGMPEDTRIRALSALITNRAALAMREDRLEEARHFAEEAMSHQSSLPRIDQVENLVVAGTIHSMEGNFKVGKQLLLAAFQLAEEMRFPSGLLTSGIALSAVYALHSLFEPAYRVCSTSIDALERLRGQAGGEADRLLYIQDKTEIYSLMILLCLILADLKRTSRYHRQALAYVERAKSRTFIEALGRGTTFAPPLNLPAEFLQREAQVLTQLQVLETRLRTSTDTTEQEQVQHAYAEAQTELDEVWKRIADIAPEYAALRRGQPLAFEAIRTLLSDPSTHR